MSLVLISIQVKYLQAVKEFFVFFVLLLKQLYLVRFFPMVTSVDISNCVPKDTRLVVKNTRFVPLYTIASTLCVDHK